MVRTNEHDGLTYDNSFMEREKEVLVIHTYSLFRHCAPFLLLALASAFHGWKILGFRMMARDDISDSRS
jgi:hypothetical protein